VTRVAFLGNSPWSVPTLEALARSDSEVVLVVTRAPVPAGRGSKLTPTDVAGSAGELGLPLAQVPTVKSGEGLARLRDAEPDFLVVVAYGEILPLEVLSAPAIAAVNLHFSLLPALRGAAPVQRALLQGSHTTGVTTMLISETLDAGGVLMQAVEDIRQDDDSGSLGARLAHIGADLMIATLSGLSDGSLVARPQNEREATFAPKLLGREIDWSLGAAEVANFVRALSPHPGASTHFRGDVLKVFRAQIAPEAEGPAGTILASGNDGLTVAAGDGAVRMLEVAPAGRKRMSGADFVRGYRPAPGDVLGFA
jgi:methionyl-tRNA formyltransferase